MIQYIKKLIQTYKYKKEIVRNIKYGPFANNLYSKQWLITNYHTIQQNFPEVWTHIDNFDYESFAESLFDLGVEFDVAEELYSIFTFFEDLKFIIRKNEYLIKRSHDNPFYTCANSDFA